MSRDIAALRSVRTRSISPENPTGAPGGGARATSGPGAHAARDLGPGWKIRPCVDLPGRSTSVLAAIDEPGCITHVWMTVDSRFWRSLLLRITWDDATEPAVEVPLGDFFCQGWGSFAQVSSRMVAVNPYGGFNCYWPMPFRRGATVTLENLTEHEARVFYQITYELGDVDAGAGYLHSQWRRSNPLEEGVPHAVVAGVEGHGHYVGTYLAWAPRSPGWWGEGEMKFYLDDDEEFPTICGTGTEDYFGGAWNFDVPGEGYTAYSTPYLGMPQVLRPDGLYHSQQRFGMYRWHVEDPIVFAERLRVDVQGLGWRSDGRYLPLRDDVASTAWFYLDRPVTRRPATPSLDVMDVLSHLP